MSRHQASRLRQKIRELRKERDHIEAELLKRRRMIRASFITRFLGTKKSKRHKPACYLSCWKNGKTVLKYVAENQLHTVKPKAEAWSEYLRLIAGWVKNSRQLEKLYRQLGEAQAVFPVKEEGKDG